MNIKKILLGIKNRLAMINLWLWWEVLQVYSFVGETDSPSDYIVTETTVARLLWHILVLILAPIAIAIKIIATLCVIVYKIGSIRLTA